MTHHSFHMVERSPWPVMGAISAFLFTSSLVEMMHTTLMNTLSASALLTSLCMYQWWRDTTREATMQGTHTYLVKMGMKWGMLLFILSEIMFFTSFFWAFFHASLAPDHELGISWPPISLTPFNPYYIPLLNTTILLSSGATVTWSHHSLMEKKYDNAFMSLLLTILLGGYFTSLQLLEYWEAPFSMSDSVYGSTFFVTTGFHGLHVLIGSIFLCINLARMKMGHLSKSHHFSFEAAAWYWHFVDIVWLLLYTFMYWWPY